jgi:hypothetical protein
LIHFRLSSTYNDAAQGRLGVRGHRIGWTDDGIKQKGARKGEFMSKAPRQKAQRNATSCMHQEREDDPFVTDVPSSRMIILKGGLG